MGNEYIVGFNVKRKIWYAYGKILTQNKRELPLVTPAKR